jgi:hypothetical protein
MTRRLEPGSCPLLAQKLSKSETAVNRKSNTGTGQPADPSQSLRAIDEFLIGKIFLLVKF